MLFIYQVCYKKGFFEQSVILLIAKKKWDAILRQVTASQIYNLWGKYIMDSIKVQQMTDKLHKTGWTNKAVGYYKSGSQIKQIPNFEVFVRNRNFDDFFKKSSLAHSGEPHKMEVFKEGSSPPMGNPKPSLTPGQTKALPALADFENYPSLMSARPNKPCILIGYDSEWENLSDGSRDMLSWQFAVIHNLNLIEFCFIRTGNKNLTFDLALGCILDCLEIKSVDVRKIRRYQYCSAWNNDENKPIITTTANLNEARSNYKYVYRGRDKGEVDGWTHELVNDMPDRFVKRANRDWAFFHTFLDYKAVDSVKVTLLCHTGLVDISGLASTEYLLKHLSDVQGGLVTMQPIRTAPRSLKNVNNTSVYPVSLTVADTMCHAPAGHKKLKNLGESVGIEKVDIPDSQKDHMLQLLENDPISFFEYASTDSVVTLLYASALYGYNNTPPITITSATATTMKRTMMRYMNVENTEEFNLKYRGLVKVSHGNYKPDNIPGYIEATSFEPISDKANSVQYYASQAYHGGYNSCSEVGYFPQETYDYDLQNAYPTAMCLVPDIDWQNPVRVQVQNRNMDIRDFMVFGGVFNPLIPFIGYCRFKFPDTVKYPCIPVNVDGVPVYPRTSDGLNGVYVAGSYIYLALRLGAEVFCENGYFLNTLLTDDLKESRSLSYAVIQLVQDRNKAKADHGKKSLEELILKTMVNSGYGKNAQNVVQKQSWVAYKDLMEDLGCSAITNPVSAMMITSIVQCELIAAQNQMHELGYVSCSVTTDGFISDCPEDVLKSLDLYGFRPLLEQSRLFLTGGTDKELWEIKHHQDDLINFTTRGNVSLHPHGVCAHNSAKSGFESDSYEDRLWLMTQVLSRTGTVDCVDSQWASFKDIVQGKTDFKVTPTIRHLHMDFDLKRKPDRSTFHTDYPIVDGITYEIAHFDTLPYDTVAEFRLHRKKKKLCDCLRTQDEWDVFFLKIDTNACGMNVKDLDWSILMSVIMGYRAGKWDIPALNGLTVVEKCEWINKHNTSKKKFKQSDWKNSRRPERQVNMLPDSYLLDKLTEMQNAI